MKLAPLFTLLIAGSAWAQTPLETINPILGDQSFVERFGRTPNPEDDDALRITTHLEWVEATLREANTEHLSEDQRQQRALLLDALGAYRERGDFPINNEVSGRRPRFVDHMGTLSAVGHLVAARHGADAARELGEAHQWDLILEMNEPVLQAFADESGVTLVELAMIQVTIGRQVLPLLTSPLLTRELEEILRRVVRRCDRVARQLRVQPRRGVLFVGVTPRASHPRIQLRGTQPPRYRQCVRRYSYSRIRRVMSRYDVHDAISVRVPFAPNDLTQPRLDQAADRIARRLTECRADYDERVRFVLRADPRGITPVLRMRRARSRPCIESIVIQELGRLGRFDRRENLITRRDVSIPASP